MEQDDIGNSLFSGLGTSAVEKLLHLARQRNDARLRVMIQEELEKFARASPSNSVIIVNIHIGDLIQQVHVLSEKGLPPSAIIEASRSHTLPALLSANEMVSGFAEAIKSRLGSPTSLVEDATPSKRGTVGQYQRFEGGRDDPVKASVYKSRYGAYPTWG